MLELQSVSGGYGGEPFLADISLSIPEHSVLSIVGPNGCGKSTLLKLIGGIKKPYSGNVLLNGISLNCIAKQDLAKSISLLPQSRNIPYISVGSMVLHGRFPYIGYPRRYRAEDKRIAEQAMSRAGVLHLRHKEMARLSGGERQRVYLAMVLAQDTEMVLLDEPTTYLDIEHQLEIMRLVRKLQAEGKTIVMVLHDLNLALTYSDKIAVMRRGCLMDCGRPEDVFKIGVLEEVFGVRVIAQQVNEAVQYFFEIK